MMHHLLVTQDKKASCSRQPQCRVDPLDCDPIRGLEKDQGLVNQRSYFLSHGRRDKWKRPFQHHHLGEEDNVFSSMWTRLGMPDRERGVKYEISGM